jgi:hypothetical protein
MIGADNINRIGGMMGGMSTLQPGGKFANLDIHANHGG